MKYEDWHTTQPIRLIRDTLILQHQNKSPFILPNVLNLTFDMKNKLLTLHMHNYLYILHKYRREFTKHI